MRTIKLVFLFATLMLLGACGETESPYRVVGQLESDRVELTAEVAEPIVEIAVAEGTRVERGALLVQQNADRASARLRELEAALAEAQARLDELIRGPRSEQIVAARANVDGAAQDLKFRVAEFERARQIHEKKLASPETLDRAQANLDAANANLKLRRAQLEELLAGTTVEELEQAQQAVEQAAARRNSAQVDLNRLTIRAPSDGIADTRLFEVGERPNAGQPVMIFLAGEQAYARVYVPESLRVQVKPGTAARVWVDGLDQSFAGKVRWIATEAAFTPYFALTERDRGRLSFAAKVDIENAAERLPDGLPVEVEFLVEGTE